MDNMREGIRPNEEYLTILVTGDETTNLGRRSKTKLSWVRWKKIAWSWEATNFRGHETDLWGSCIISRETMTSNHGNVCTFREVEESRRIRVDGYLFHDLSSETETPPWRWLASIHKGAQKKKEMDEFLYVCERGRAQPRGLIRCRLIQAVSLPLRVLHT